MAGSESGNVALLTADGRKQWRRDLDAPVRGLARLEISDGKTVIAAATAAGWIVLLSLEGEVVCSQAMGAGVTTLQALALQDGVGLLVGTEDGRVVALQMGGSGARS